MRTPSTTSILYYPNQRDEYLERHAQLTAENQQLETQLEELRDATAAQREEVSDALYYW